MPLLMFNVMSRKVALFSGFPSKLENDGAGAVGRQKERGRFRAVHPPRANPAVRIKEGGNNEERPCLLDLV